MLYQVLQQQTVTVTELQCSNIIQGYNTILSPSLCEGSPEENQQ